MGESGCLKDGCFQNLQVEGFSTGLVPYGGFRVFGPVNALPPSASKLAKNTYYAEDTVNAEVFLLPTIAESTVGDWIAVRDTGGWTVTGDKITIGNALNGDLAIGCHLTGINVSGTGTKETVTVSTSGQNSVIMAGLVHGAGGAGSNVLFIFNGARWTASGVSRNIGNGAENTVGTGGMEFANTPA